jgi:hypothetical protein
MNTPINMREPLIFIPTLLWNRRSIIERRNLYSNIVMKDIAMGGTVMKEAYTFGRRRVNHETRGGSLGPGV